MADLDLTQFEGHTPGPWWCHGQVWIEGGGVTLADLAGASKADAALMTAAPKLLAEVKRQAAEIERLRDAQMQGDALRARLAEIEAQEPICIVQMTTTGGRLRYNPDAKQLPEHGMTLYARPVPAIPAGWKLVPVEPTEGMIEAGKDAKRRRLLAAVKELSADKPYDTMAQAMAVHEEWAAMVAAAIAEARREGAEHMKAKCIALKDDALFVFGEPSSPQVADVIDWYSGSIHALPLPTGEREAVSMTADYIQTARAAIEAAVLAINNLEVRRG